MLLIKFDEEALAPYELLFLEDWAGRLEVSLEVLLSRLLTGAAVGNYYLANYPGSERVSERGQNGTLLMFPH